MAAQQHPTVGTVAGPDDVAPEGTVITQEHVDVYRHNVEDLHRRMGLSTEGLWKD